MSILVRRCQKRSELVHQLYEEVNEDWRLDENSVPTFDSNGHQEATFASDVAELCGECSSLRPLFEQSWEALRSRLEHIQDTQEVGRAFQAALGMAIDVVQRLLRLCEQSRKTGHAIEASAPLQNDLAKLRALAALVEAEWPFVRPELMAAARAAYQRGEYRSAEDLLNESDDGDSEAD